MSHNDIVMTLIAGHFYPGVSTSYVLEGLHRYGYINI